MTVANCDKKYYNAQLKTSVKFSEFARYWKSLIEHNYPTTEPCLYLKVRNVPSEASYATILANNKLICLPFM